MLKQIELDSKLNEKLAETLFDDLLFNKYDC